PGRRAAGPAGGGPGSGRRRSGSGDPGRRGPPVASARRGRLSARARVQRGRDGDGDGHDRGGRPGQRLPGHQEAEGASDMDERLRISTADAELRSEAAAERFRASAWDAELTDVAVGSLDSPVGELFVAVTPRGLASIAFEGIDRDVFLERLVRELSPRVVATARATDDVRRELD